MSYIDIAKEVFDLEISELLNVKKRIGEEFDEIVELIYKSSGKVVVTGIGKSGIIGKKIAASLASTGTKAVFMNSAEGLHGDLGMINHNDIVLAISNSGNSQEVVGLLLSIENIGAKLIAMTGNLESRLAEAASFVLDIGIEKEACPMNLAPTTSTTAALLMGDALVIALMKQRNFKSEDFAIYHPGGTLGRKLLVKVRDLMKKDIPRVYINDNIKVVLDEILNKKSTMTLVFNMYNQPIGIITDGDIKRAIFNNYDNIDIVYAKSIMSKGFKYIDENEMLTVALDIFEKEDISSLVVMKNDVVTGTINIKDIIDFGI